MKAFTRAAITVFIGFLIKINHYKNPRFENENNTLIAKPVGLIELGLKPIYLDNDILTNEINIAKKYSQRVIKNSILAKSQWKI